MSRIQTINPESATGHTRELLDGVQKKLGRVPNLIRVFANSDVVLEAYLGLGALANGKLPVTLREQIALTVAETNDCAYCLAVHTALGRMSGLNEQQILDSRQGASVDRKEEAALRFANAVVVKMGKVDDEDLNRIRKAGYDDGEIAEIVANVALNIYTNYFNHVAQTELDFPEAAPLEGAHTRV